MQGQSVGFESSYRRHLDQEQRRAVLEALGGSIHPDSTLGEVIDAAEALGFGEQMGDLSLADLADALLSAEGPAVVEAASAGQLEADDDEDEYDDEDEDDEVDEDEDDVENDEDEDDEPEQLELTSRSGRGRKKKAAAAKKPTRAARTTSKKSTKKAAKATVSKKGVKKATKANVSKKGAKASASKKTTKKAAKANVSKKGAKKAEAGRGAARRGKGRSTLTAAEVDERMSLDQAAEFFLPYVESIGEATMQALEEETGVARRKLRFHVGQLVRHGYLERHGMGRGTYYTIA